MNDDTPSQPAEPTQPGPDATVPHTDPAAPESGSDVAPVSQATPSVAPENFGSDLPTQQDRPSMDRAGFPAASDQPSGPTADPQSYPDAALQGYPSSDQVSYPQAGQDGYPVGGQSGYPSSGQPSYPTDAQGGYPGYPGDQPGYPTASQPGYPAQGQPGYHAQGQPGYPSTPQGSYTQAPSDYPAPGQPTYSSDGQPSYPSMPANGYPSAQQAGYATNAQPGYPNPQGYPPAGQGGYASGGQASYATGSQGGYPSSGQAGYPSSGQGGYAPAGQSGYPSSSPSTGQSPYQFASTPKANSGNKKTLMIVGGVLALVLIAGVAIMALNRTTVTPVPDPTSTSKPPVTVGADSPTAAVQGYFDALAANNAAGVLALSSESSSDTTFITPEVLTAASAGAPIADVTLTEGDTTSSTAEIVATYTIGGTPVRSTFRSYKRNGVWTLSRVTGRVYVADLIDPLLGVTINGVAIGDDKMVNLVPGGYTVATSSDTFTVSKKTFTVKAVDDADVPSFDLALTDEGLDSYREAVKKWADSCKKPDGIVDAKCGLYRTAPAGAAKIKSITCTVANEATLDRLRPTRVTLDAVRSYPNIKFDCKATDTKGSGYTTTNYVYAVTGVYSEKGWEVSPA